MTNEEIIAELTEDLTNLMNCTDDPKMRARLHFIRDGHYIDYCKCPNCGSKFTPSEAFKGSFKILASTTLNNKIPKI